MFLHLIEKLFIFIEYKSYLHFSSSFFHINSPYSLREKIFTKRINDLLKTLMSSKLAELLLLNVLL